MHDSIIIFGNLDNSNPGYALNELFGTIKWTFAETIINSTTLSWAVTGKGSKVHHEALKVSNPVHSIIQRDACITILSSVDRYHGTCFFCMQKIDSHCSAIISTRIFVNVCVTSEYGHHFVIGKRSRI